jgi:allantoinase
VSVSERLDLVVGGGTLVTPDGLRRSDLGVAAGRIVCVADDLAGEAPQLLDAAGMHVLPGALDAHVHLNDPGRSDWEGFASGTAALAAGGATACLDMPLNSVPPTTTPAGFAAKRQRGEAAARVDFGLWGGIVPGNAGELEALGACGVVGFKAFMCDSGVEEFPACDAAALREGMAVAATLGLPVAVHAEDQETVRELTARAVAAGATSARDFLATRPVSAELAAIEQALDLARETDCALHVVHVSCRAGVELVATARAEGLDASCETCPHYLVLDEDDLELVGAAAKCAPPLRTGAERESLWSALADRSLPMVASDHSPSPPELKSGGSIFQAWGGVSGAQTALPLMLSEGHHARGLGLELVAELTAGFPARRFALPGKGRIEVGADADLAIVALDDSYRLSAESLLTRYPISPYIGRELRGRVVRTLLRGHTVYADGRVQGEPRGRLLRPCPQPAKTQEVE